MTPLPPPHHHPLQRRRQYNHNHNSNDNNDIDDYHHRRPHRPHHRASTVAPAPPVMPSTTTNTNDDDHDDDAAASSYDDARSIASASVASATSMLSSYSTATTTTTATTTSREERLQRLRGGKHSLRSTLQRAASTSTSSSRRTRARSRSREPAPPPSSYSSSSSSLHRRDRNDDDYYYGSGTSAADTAAAATEGRGDEGGEGGRRSRSRSRSIGKSVVDRRSVIVSSAVRSSRDDGSDDGNNDGNNYCHRDRHDSDNDVDHRSGGTPLPSQQPKPQQRPLATAAAAGATAATAHLSDGDNDNGDDEWLSLEDVLGRGGGSGGGNLGDIGGIGGVGYNDAAPVVHHHRSTVVSVSSSSSSSSSSTTSSTSEEEEDDEEELLEEEEEEDVSSLPERAAAAGSFAFANVATATNSNKPQPQPQPQPQQQQQQQQQQQPVETHHHHHCDERLLRPSSPLMPVPTTTTATMTNHGNDDDQHEENEHQQQQQQHQQRGLIGGGINGGVGSGHSVASSEASTATATTTTTNTTTTTKASTQDYERAKMSLLSLLGNFSSGKSINSVNNNKEDAAAAAGGAAAKGAAHAAEGANGGEGGGDVAVHNTKSGEPPLRSDLVASASGVGLPNVSDDENINGNNNNNDVEEQQQEEDDEGEDDDEVRTIQSSSVQSSTVYVPPPKKKLRSASASGSTSTSGGSRSGGSGNQNDDLPAEEEEGPYDNDHYHRHHDDDDDDENDDDDDDDSYIRSSSRNSLHHSPQEDEEQHHHHQPYYCHDDDNDDASSPNDDDGNDNNNNNEHSSTTAATSSADGDNDDDNEVVDDDDDDDNHHHRKLTEMERLIESRLAQIESERIRVEQARAAFDDDDDHDHDDEENEIDNDEQQQQQQQQQREMEQEQEEEQHDNDDAFDTDCFGPEIVGRDVRMRFSHDRRWYTGTILSYDDDALQHVVECDDGTLWETVLLREEEGKSIVWLDGAEHGRDGNEATATTTATRYAATAAAATTTTPPPTIIEEKERASSFSRTVPTTATKDHCDVHDDDDDKEEQETFAPVVVGPAAAAALACAAEEMVEEPQPMPVPGGTVQPVDNDVDPAQQQRQQQQEEWFFTSVGAPQQQSRSSSSVLVEEVTSSSSDEDEEDEKQEQPKNFDDFAAAAARQRQTHRTAAAAATAAAVPHDDDDDDVGDSQRKDREEEESFSSSNFGFDLLGVSALRALAREMDVDTSGCAERNEIEERLEMEMRRRNDVEQQAAEEEEQQQQQQQQWTTAATATMTSSHEDGDGMFVVAEEDAHASAWQREDDGAGRDEQQADVDLRESDIFFDDKPDAIGGSSKKHVSWGDVDLEEGRGVMCKDDSSAWDRDVDVEAEGLLNKSSSSKKSGWKQEWQDDDEANNDRIDLDRQRAKKRRRFVTGCGVATVCLALAAVVAGVVLLVSGGESNDDKGATTSANENDELDGGFAVAAPSLAPSVADDSSLFANADTAAPTTPKTFNNMIFPTTSPTPRSIPMPTRIPTQAPTAMASNPSIPTRIPTQTPTMAPSSPRTAPPSNAPSRSPVLHSAPAKLIRHYKLDGDVTDSARGKHGMFMGGTASYFPGGITGQAAVLNGTTYLQLHPENSLSDWSVSMWFMLTADVGVWARVWEFGRRDPNSRFFSLVAKQGGTSAIGTNFLTPNGGGNQLSTGVAAQVNQWYHVTVTFDKEGGGQKVYVDGKLKVSGTFDSESFEDWDFPNWFIGYSNWNGVPGFVGFIDDIRIYDGVLSQEDVAALSDGTWTDSPTPSPKATGVPVTDTTSPVSSDPTNSPSKYPTTPPSGDHTNGPSGYPTRAPTRSPTILIPCNTERPLCPFLSQSECCTPSCSWDVETASCSFSSESAVVSRDWNGVAELGQTHVVKAVGETRHAPRLIANREVELLFTPDQIRRNRRLAVFNADGTTNEWGLELLGVADVVVAGGGEWPTSFPHDTQILFDGEDSEYYLPNSRPDVDINIDLDTQRLVGGIYIDMISGTTASSIAIGLRRDDGDEGEENDHLPTEGGWEWYDAASISSCCDGEISVDFSQVQARYVSIQFRGGNSSMSSNWGLRNIKIKGNVDGLADDGPHNKESGYVSSRIKSPRINGKSFLPSEASDVHVAAFSAGGALLGVLQARSPEDQRPLLEQSLTSTPLDPYSTLAWSATLPWNWIVEGTEVVIGTVDASEPTELLLHRLVLENLAAFSEHTLSRTKVAIFGDENDLSQLNEYTVSAKKVATDIFGSIPVAGLSWVDSELWHLPYLIVDTSSGPKRVSNAQEHVAATGKGPEPSWEVLKNYLAIRHSLANTGRGLAVTEKEGDSSPYASGTSIFMGWSRQQKDDSSWQWEDLGYWGNVAAAAWTGWCAMKAGDECSNYFLHEIGHAFSLHHFSEGTAVNWGVGEEYPDDGINLSSHPWGFDTYSRRFRTWYDHKDLSGKRDPMNGGEPPNSETCFAQFTAYQAKKAQDWGLNAPLLLSAVTSDVPSDGAYKFSETTHKYESVSDDLTSAVGKTALQPDRVGVPVVTIIGTIGASDDVCQTYPPLRSSSGNTFVLPDPYVASLDPTVYNGAAYYIEVRFQDGTSERGLIAAQRLVSWDNSLLMFSFNVAADRYPVAVELYRFDSKAYPILSPQSAKTLLHVQTITPLGSDPLAGIPSALRVGRGWLGDSSDVVLADLCSPTACSSNNEILWRGGTQAKLSYQTNLPSTGSTLQATHFGVPVIHQEDGTAHEIVVVVSRFIMGEGGLTSLLGTSSEETPSSSPDATYGTRVWAPAELNSDLKSGTYLSSNAALRVWAEDAGTILYEFHVSIKLSHDTSPATPTLTAQPTLPPTRSPSSDLYYPDYNRGGCFNDGEEPSWMQYFYTSKEDCCSGHFKWNYAGCLVNVTS